MTDPTGTAIAAAPGSSSGSSLALLSPASPTSPFSPTSAPTAPIAVRRQIGPSSLRVFPIALSGTAFGWRADEQATTAILDRFLELGGDLIDTADSYAGGRSEIMIGNWMRRRGVRDRLTLSTKIGKSADHPGLSARSIAAAADASLTRLGVDVIDVLYLHVDDPIVSFDETLAAVDELIRAGKVRWFGGSHHTPERLLEARIAAGQLGVAPMIAVQNQYHLLHRAEVENGLSRVAAQLDLGLMPRFALAGGFLAGSYRSRADLERRERGAEASRYLNRRGLRILAALDRVAAETGSTVATVSLAWLLSRPRVVAPLVSVSDAAQLDALMAAPALALGRHQLTELDRASA